MNGLPIDEQTRCVHYHSPLDVIAIRFKCCNEYYPCYDCHQETAGHTAENWPEPEWDTPAVLCGICKREMSIREYMGSGNRCPYCSSPFNPNCRLHYHLYFDMKT